MQPLKLVRDMHHNLYGVLQILEQGSVGTAYVCPHLL